MNDNSEAVAAAVRRTLASQSFRMAGPFGTVEYQAPDRVRSTSTGFGEPVTTIRIGRTIYAGFVMQSGETTRGFHRLDQDDPFPGIGPSPAGDNEDLSNAHTLLRMLLGMLRRARVTQFRSAFRFVVPGSPARPRRITGEVVIGAGLVQSMTVDEHRYEFSYDDHALTITPPPESEIVRGDQGRTTRRD